MTCAFLVPELSEFNTFNPKKKHYNSDKGFYGTVVNQALSSMHGQSLEITLIFPLNRRFYIC